MELRKVKIYRSTNSFLYLPIYLAKDLNIFQDLLPGIEFCYEKIPDENVDIEATQRMLSSNKTEDGTLSIAIADPTAIFSYRFQTNDLRENCVIVGSLINKLPFWAVNHINEEIRDEYSFGNNYNEVAHTDDNWATAYFLGRQVMLNSSISPPSDKPNLSFGTELEYISKNQEFTHSKKIVAITADLLELAKKIEVDNGEDLYVNYKFSHKRGEFLTTGILTSKNVYDRYQDQLELILTAILKAISTLYSSKKIAKYLIEKLDKNHGFDIDGKPLDYVVEKIFDERFYPLSLQISPESWRKAITARRVVEQWEYADHEGLYLDHVDSRLALKAEKQIAINSGINAQMFQSEIDQLISELYNKEKQARLYSKVVTFSKQFVIRNKQLLLKILYVICFFWLIWAIYLVVSLPLKDALPKLIPVLIALLVFIGRLLITKK